MVLIILVCTDVLSLSGFEGVSASSNMSHRDANHGDCSVRNQHNSFVDQMHKPGDFSPRYSAHDSVNEVSQNSSCQVMNSDDNGSKPKCDGHSTGEANQPVFLDEISSSVDENSGKEEGILDNCGILPSTCLPCLASTVPSVEKRRSLSSSPPSARKKAALKLPFKWKEGHAIATLRKFYFLCFYVISK